MASVMLDILNRTIKEGDIVVVKGNGSSYSSSQKSMEVGIRMGDSIKTLTCSRNPSDKFLIENPGPKELEIKEEILSKIAASKRASAMKAAASSKLKADKPGTIYLMSRYNAVFVYLGKVKVQGYFDDVLGAEEEGKLYVLLETWNRDKSTYSHLDMKKFKELLSKRYLSTFNTSTISRDFEFIKSNKTYQEILGEISDFDPNFEIEFDCTCTVNGVAPYKKGCYKITKK